MVLTWGLGGWFGDGLCVGELVGERVRGFQIEVSVVGDFSGSNDRDFLQVSWSQGCGESSSWVWISD